jgi:ADP-ribosylation factor-like protein 2
MVRRLAITENEFKGWVGLRLETEIQMGLLTILKKLRQKEREMRLLMLGLDNAGKTTILKRINGEPVDTISPTLGFNIKTIEYQMYTIHSLLITHKLVHNPIQIQSKCNEHRYKLNIWDVGGQKSIRSYWRNYFEQTDGLVWVIDSSDRRRLEDCKRELGQLMMEERLAGASLLILANKQDLPGSLSVDEIRQVRK